MIKGLIALVAILSGLYFIQSFELKGKEMELVEMQIAQDNLKVMIIQNKSKCLKELLEEHAKWEKEQLLKDIKDVDKKEIVNNDMSVGVHTLGLH